MNQIKKISKIVLNNLLSFLGFAFVGGFAGYIIYQNALGYFVMAFIIALLGSKEYRKYIISKKKSSFEKQFCDYLDSISSSLSCGRNSYESFILAANEMEVIYRRDSPICVESRLISSGLQNGRTLKELLYEMSNNVDSENVKTFSEVYSICITSGGNLKMIVNDTKMLIQEKISVEREIKTIMAGTKNEFVIMMFMPIVVLCSLRFLNPGLATYSSFVANTVAVCLFIFAYLVGSAIIKVEV